MTKSPRTLRLMKIFITALILAASTFSAAPANAAERLTVIELFTSQGCSSCPPADAMLKTLRDRPNVLTLSWAVDYWDRLGWKDTFGSAYNTSRQSAYNRRFGRRGNYTPQMVFDGRTEGVGSRTSEVRKAFEAARNAKHPYQAPVLTLNGSTVKLALKSNDAMKNVSVRIVWFLADAKVQIGRGENGGRHLEYTNVVLNTKVIDGWDGTAKNFTLDADKARAFGADHVAVLLQDKNGHGPIVGAAVIDL